MVSLTALWLPIVLSAVVVFIASSVIHMVIGWHNGDALLMTDGYQGAEPEHMSCTVYSGASGGPILNEAGYLVGITTMVQMVYTRDYRTNAPTNFYVPVPHISMYAPLTPEVIEWITRTMREHP